MQRTAWALRSRCWARILATRLFPAPPLPCSERWSLPVALTSIPSLGTKVRLLLSDQFPFVRRAVVVLEARPAGQAVAQVRQWIVGRGFGGAGGGIRRWHGRGRARRHVGRRGGGGVHRGGGGGGVGGGGGGVLVGGGAGAAPAGTLVGGGAVGASWRLT